jgi:hypothetical protein
MGKLTISMAIWCTNQLKKFGDENADTQEMVWPKLSGGEAPSSFLEYLE